MTAWMFFVSVAKIREHQEELGHAFPTTQGRDRFLRRWPLPKHEACKMLADSDKFRIFFRRFHPQFRFPQSLTLCRTAWTIPVSCRANPCTTTVVPSTTAKRFQQLLASPLPQQFKNVFQTQNTRSMVANCCCSSTETQHWLWRLNWWGVSAAAVHCAILTRQVHDRRMF